MSASPAVSSKDHLAADEPAESGDFLIRSISFPVVLRPSRPLTNDQLLEFCAANDSLRIERNPAGELIVMTPAGGKTSNLESYLSRELDLWAERDGSGIAFNANGGFSLPDHSVRAADVAWLSLEKWNSLTAEAQTKFIPFCPEFVIELRSPSESLADLQSKMSDWIANGAQLAWLLDPQRKLAVIYRPGQSPETCLHPETLEGEGPIAGFSLKMQRLWE
jgi:Uma2 family endonuclease